MTVTCTSCSYVQSESDHSNRGLEISHTKHRRLGSCLCVFGSDGLCPLLRTGCTTVAVVCLSFLYVRTYCCQQWCVCHFCTYLRTTFNSCVFVISVRTCVLLSTVVCLSFLYIHTTYMQLLAVVCLSFL